MQLSTGYLQPSSAPPLQPSTSGTLEGVAAGLRGAHSPQARGHTALDQDCRPSTRLSAQDTSVPGTPLPAEGAPPQAHASHRCPAKLGPSALTDHLLQLVVVPVDGPGQGARVFRHDGRWQRLARRSLTHGALGVNSPHASPTPSRRPPPAAWPSLGAHDAGARGSSAAPRRGRAAAADVASCGSASRGP